MQHKILSLLVVASSITCVNAQTTTSRTGYAITASQKGQMGWREVRQVDMATGEELKTVFATGQEAEILNARTGKPVVKREPEERPYFNNNNLRIQIKKGIDDASSVIISTNKQVDANRSQTDAKTSVDAPAQTVTIENNGNVKIIRIHSNVNTNTNTNVVRNIHINVDSVFGVQRRLFTSYRQFREPMDKPFASNSAACAYDKKHDRLYYTPLGFNQLRYIDLKTNKIYYFEDEPFGVSTGRGDVGNQITRMTFGADGNGYALTNNGEHLIRFTTGKKPEITDLGTLTDDAANERNSIHSYNNNGGDLIADINENLYLISANRKVFKIDMNSKVATFQGAIQGLPEGFHTNGAMVEEGAKVLVCSSESTEGYFRFDLNTLQAEKASSAASVFNASDLANGNLAFDKKEESKLIENFSFAKKVGTVPDGITVYPNPVTDGMVKLNFTNQPAGSYQIQLLDFSGKTTAQREVAINSKVQSVEFTLPQAIAKGTYMIKVTSEANRVAVLSKLIVE